MFRSRSEEAGEPEKTIDLSQRYDVYVNEHPHGMVVFTNVRILEQKSLFADGNRFDLFNRFIELEQADGSRVLISRHGLSRICLHGVPVLAELVRSSKKQS